MPTIEFELSHEGCLMNLKEDTSFEVEEDPYNECCVLYKCNGCGTTMSLTVRVLT